MSGGAAWIILSRHYRRRSDGTLPNFSSGYKASNKEKSFFASLRENFMPTKEEKQQFEEERRLAEKKYNEIRKLRYENN